MEKIKCYVLDFGDTDFISTDKNEILKWIDTDMDDILYGDPMQFTISVTWMSQEEYDSLPDWA